MKNLLANQSISQLSFYLFCTFPAFISLQLKGLVAIVFLVIQFYLLTQKKPENTSRGFWLPFLHTAPFLFFIISLGYSEDVVGGYKYIERLILLFILPWLLYFNRSFINLESAQKTLRFYGFFLTLFVLYCIVSLWLTGTFAEAFNTEGGYYIIRTKLERISGLHPTYISLLIAVGLFSIQYGLKKETIASSLKKWAYLATFILVTGLLVASSKMIMFCTVIGFIIIVSEGLSFKAISVRVVTMAAVLVLAVALVKPVRERVVTMFTAATEQGVEQKNPDSLRKGIFKSSIEVISENIWFGAGVGDSQTLLDAKYEKYGFTVAFQKHFNTHNQYLHFWITAGVFSMLFFIGLLVAQLFIAIYCKNYLHLAFVVLMSLSFLTENVLSRQDGIFLFAFFSSLFSYMSWSKNGSRVFINGRYLSQSVSGVQRYAAEMNHYLQMFSNRFTTLVDSKSSGDSHLHVSWPFAHGLLWEQLFLPVYLKCIGSPLLINFCNSAPVCYRNQFVTLHDTAFKENPKWFSNNFIRWYGFMIPRILKKSQLIITVSEFSKKEIEKHFGVPMDKIHVLYNGMPRFTDSDRKTEALVDGNYVLTVGSISERKNQISLIEAFVKLKSTDLKLVVAGSYNAEIFGGQTVLIDKLKAQERVVFIENPDDEELSNLYRHCCFTMYVPYYEGFGLPVLESIAHFKLALVSDIPVFRELFTSHVVFLKSNNYDNIAFQIEQTYQSENQGLDILGSEKKLREIFSYEHSAKRLLDLVEGNENK